MSTLLAHGNNIVEIATDEGVSWTVTYYGKTYDGIVNDGRIFLATDEGVKYSDDEGITWLDTEVTSVSKSLYDFVINDNNRIYVSTEDGVAYSEDNGTTWVWSGLSDGEWTLASTEDFEYDYGNGIVAYGDNGAVLLDYYSGKQVITSMPCYVRDKKLIYVPLKLPEYDGTVEQIDKISTYVLNNILYPYCSLKYTGYLLFPLGEPNVNNSSNARKRVVISNSEFWTKFKNESIIDWENDVGMGKIGSITLSDVLEDDEEENVVTEDIENITNPNYIKTIDTVKAIVEDVRDKIVADNVSDIESIQLDGLKSIIDTVDEEYLDNDIKAYNTYVDAARKTNEVLCQNLINYIFNFDEYSLRRLVRSSLYEMVKSKSGLVKCAVTKALKNGQKNFDVLSIGLKFNFDKAVREQLKGYSIEVSEASKKVDSDMDKELIGIASTFYNNYERADLISEVISFLTLLVDNFKTSELESGEIYNCIKDVNDFITEAKKSDDKKSIYDNYTFLYKSYDYSKMSSYLYNKLKSDFEAKLDSLSFSSTNSDFYTSSISGLEEARQLRVFKYVNEIHDKFKERCIELLDYVYTDVGGIDFSVSKEIETTNIYKWVSGNDNTYPYFSKVLNPKFKTFGERILERYNNYKEKL